MTKLASQITSLTVVYSIVYLGVNQRKHQSSASLAFVWEIHRGPVNFPHKWPVTRKMFPFDDVIMLYCCNHNHTVKVHFRCYSYKFANMRYTEIKKDISYSTLVYKTLRHSNQPNSLRWRHNDHAGVSNHQPPGCLLNRLFRRKSKKTSKLRVTGLSAGNSPGTGEFSAQMASYAENVSIWWRHHVGYRPHREPEGFNFWSAYILCVEN